MASLPVLVLNSGSSSIKFSIYEAGGGSREKLLEGAVEGIGTDLGQFWVKISSGDNLVNQKRALPTLAEAFSGWRDSPPHRANMLLKDATQMGIAAAYAPGSKYKVFWALILAAPSADRRG